MRTLALPKEVEHWSTDTGSPTCVGIDVPIKIALPLGHTGSPTCVGIDPPGDGIKQPIFLTVTDSIIITQLCHKPFLPVRLSRENTTSAQT